jgi:SSS family solute:Na+ symporter
VKSLLDAWWKMAGLFASGMLGLFLLGFLDKRVGGLAAKIAAILGLLLIFWLSFKDYFPLRWQSPFDSKLTVVFGTLTIVGIGVLVERVWRRNAS